MPNMKGADLAERLCRARPGVRILLMSGYADDARWSARSDAAPVAFLPKPFTSVELVAKVREVLDAPWDGSAHGKSRGCLSPELFSKRQFWHSLAAVVLGNAAYFSLDRFLPPAGRHVPVQNRLGTGHRLLVLPGLLWSVGAAEVVPAAVAHDLLLYL